MKPKLFLISLFNLIFSLYLLFLWWQNKLTYYIHVRYVWYIFASALFTFILSSGYTFFLIFWVFKKSWLEEFNNLIIFSRSQLKIKNWFVILLTSILLVVIFIPAKPLGLNNSLAVSGISNNDLKTLKSIPKTTLKQNIVTGLNIQEWSKILQNDIQLKTYKNQRLNLTGFVSNKNNEGEFFISRYVIICCAVDASLITIAVKVASTITDTNLKNGDWIEITGRLSLENIFDQNQPTIILENLNMIAVPENPYIYYN